MDTDFCAMCGHDWCSVRISKEIQEFGSGKDEGSQPERRTQPSPALAERARQAAAHHEKLGCHSDVARDGEQAKRIQEKLVRIPS